MTSPLCYAAGVPFLVWALMILVGVDADVTRVPFLMVEGVAVFVSIYGLRRKYRRHFKTCPDCAETILASARECRYCGFRFDR